MTAKELFYLAFAFAAATLAGYGALRIGWSISGERDTLSILVAIAVGLVTLALAVKGVSAIHDERRKREIEQHVRNQRISG